jgi:uncharacterized protein YecE (DUF72 family)
MQTRLDVLADKLGPVLFQLPARFHAKPERLDSFLALLPARQRYVFEFRHESWYEPHVLRLLRARGVGLCISDHHDAPSPWTVTARHVYIRAHGPGGRYRDNYSEETLRQWAAQIVKWSRAGRDVFVYFDNDVKAAAPQDARRLGLLVAESGAVRKRAR